MSCASGDRDGPTVVRLLRETIIQLCRANAPFGTGRVEIDGIICITGPGSGQQIVVKVHEVLDDQSAGPPYPGGVFDRDRYLPPVEHTSTAPAADVGVDVKRRRLDVTSAFNGLPLLPLPASSLRPHQSALYDYLSRFGLSRVSAADFDGRFGVKDLSLKSATVVGRRDTADSVSDGRTTPVRRPASPVYGAGDSFERQMPAPARQPRPPYAERWSPSQPIPAIPQCFVCGYRFGSAEALGEHNESVHSIFTCLCCFKTFTSRSNLERHSRLHTGHRPYACQVCGKTFSRKDHLSNHATKHAYKCGTCTRRCSDQSALAEHYRAEHPGTPLAAVCAYCNKGFGSVELYEEHVKVHPQFHVSAGEPTGDQTQVAPPPPVRHRCQMCGFEAMDRVCLVQHQQLMHYTPMALLRDAYDSSPMSLQRLDQQSYRCLVCGFTANSLLALRQHEASHVFDVSSQPLASYDQCPRRSPPGDSRDRQLIGTDGYVCRQCGRQFDTYSSLCQHIQELSSCAPGEDALVGSQHRDKRKQKQPKPVMAAEAEDEDEEVNVVSPVPGDEKTGLIAVDSQVSRVDVAHGYESPANEIRMEPIRSIMNRSSMQVAKVPAVSSPSPPPLAQLRDDPESGSAHAAPPRLIKREPVGGADDWSSSLRGDASNHSVADLASESSPSRHDGSLDDLVVNNNNNEGKEGDRVSSRCEYQSPPPSSSTVEQTRCVVCGAECADFAEMEAHCQAEHSRSPCMYCPKTFAQKANRDRHMCLHTGDRPYGCPECGERFSRGDKLKMHRVRTHGVLYPLYGSRGGQRDRDGAASSTSQSPMMSNCVDGGATSTTINGSAAAGQEVDSPPIADSELNLQGSATVMSGGEWIDLRVSMCRESRKLQSALSGLRSTDQTPLGTFPKQS